MKKEFLKKQYKESFTYIWECKKPIFYIILIFLLFVLIGFFLPVPQALSSEIMKYIQELLKKTEGFGFGDMFSFIFLNNLKTSFFGMIFGVLFGVFPVFNSLANGYILGFVASKSVLEQGISVLWRIFPHGIFELPAVFIALGVGLKLGTFFLADYKKRFLKENLRNSLRVFVLIILPLLAIAALIESLLILFS
jgi:stage II sporulation protein M